jgi:polyhydroxybutyrate depolymerase
MRRAGLVLLVPVLALLAACGSPAPAVSPPAVPAGPQPAGPDAVRIDVDGRPFFLHVPTSYRPGTAVPLVVVLHGYTSSGAQTESYFRLIPQSDARGFLYAMPDGQTDRGGARYWNATDACCDFYRGGVDDSAYLSHLISAVRRYYSVDRVFLVGHSNGAFMAIRMACEHADQITAIVGLNGAMWNDRSRCHPSRPVSFLDIRSTADETIHYGGGLNGGDRVPYPSAETTDADWRDADRCDAGPHPGAPLDLVTDLPGAETEVTSWSCAGHSTVESWRINNGVHSPALSAGFAAGVVDFMYAQLLG